MAHTSRILLAPYMCMPSETPSIDELTKSTTSAFQRWLATLGILLPCVVFWVVCVYFLSPLPVTDDYDAVLLYTAHLHEAPTLAGQLGVMLFHQHNEYKPIWANALIALQYKLAGHVNFRALSLMGDAQVMLLAWLLWKCFAPATIDYTRRMVLFVPLALIVFQMNYAETLNWAMPALQNIGVITFALMAMWLLTLRRSVAFIGACAAMALAIAASGNGFLVYPVGMVLLWQQRRLVRMAPWTVTVMLCGAVYFTHYARVTHAPISNSAAGALWHVPLFMLSFLGSFGGIMRPIVRYGSIPFGLAMLAAILFAAARRYDRANPAISGFALFLLLTVLGVTATRGSMGYDQSLSGRYKLYSDMLLACVYCCGLHLYRKRLEPQRNRLYRWTLAAACVFFLIGMTFGIRAMHVRQRSLNEGIALYKGSSGSDGPLSVTPATTSAEERKAAAVLDAHFRDALREADREDIYHLP